MELAVCHSIASAQANDIIATSVISTGDVDVTKAVCGGSVVSKATTTGSEAKRCINRCSDCCNSAETIESLRLEP